MKIMTHISLYDVSYSLHYAKYLLTWVFCRNISVPWASLSVLDCDDIRFPICRVWNGKDVSLLGIYSLYDYIKECGSFIM